MQRRNAGMGRGHRRRLRSSARWFGPVDSIEVVVWFALAGAVVVFAAADRIGAWALLVPAIYLPVHLLIGIGRAILRNGGVRTDPPPTAAIVPLAMLLAAAAAGALAATIVRRSQ